MKILFIASVIFTAFMISPQLDARRGAGEIKSWHFHARNGEIIVKLSAAADRAGKHTVLSIEPEGDLIPTTDEEAAILRQALHKMPPLGYDPRNLEMITTWLQNSDYRVGVELAVAKSGKWKACQRMKYCHAAEGVANQFLRSIDAFKSFDQALQPFDLSRKSMHMDDLAVGGGEEHVSCSGLVVIALAPK